MPWFHLKTFLPECAELVGRGFKLENLIDFVLQGETI
jgi:hypothetical protein